LIDSFPQKDAGFNGVLEEEESESFLEPYIIRAGMERELKNERGFRGKEKIVPRHPSPDSLSGE